MGVRNRCLATPRRTCGIFSTAATMNFDKITVYVNLSRYARIQDGESPYPASNNWKKHPHPNFLCKLKYTPYSVYSAPSSLPVCTQPPPCYFHAPPPRCSPGHGWFDRLPSSRLRRRRHESPMIPSRIILKTERGDTLLQRRLYHPLSLSLSLSLL